MQAVMCENVGFRCKHWGCCGENAGGLGVSGGF